MMTSQMVSRRKFLAGLLAVPAVVSFSSLMPIRGVKYDPIIRLQSWKFGTEASGEWWAHEGRLSRIGSFETAMRDEIGQAYWQEVDRRSVKVDCFSRDPNRPLVTSETVNSGLASDHAFAVGVAHGVRRDDPPLLTDHEWREQINARWKKDGLLDRWMVQRAKMETDPEYQRHEAQFRAAHAQKTEMLFARRDAMGDGWGY